ncbi:MAG: glycosyltransferase family 2 protein, partial [Microgenomates group bacterium]
MKKVALVTVNFHGCNDTLALLKSAKKLDVKGLEFRFVVVDKTPGEWLGDHIKKGFPNLKLLQAGCDKGFTGSYNLGMKYAAAWGADYIAIINNDTLIGDKKLLKKLIKVLDDNPDAAVVSPKIYFASGYEFHKNRYSQKDKGKVLWYAGGHFDWANVKSVHRGIDEVDTGKYDGVGETGFISGCCLAVRCGTLEKYGYFNEDYFAYFEDNDWQQRILLGGGNLYYHGGTHIYHKVSRTMGIGSPETDYLLTRNRLYFTTKYASLRTKFAVLREAMRLLLGGRAAQKKAIVDFLRGVKGPSPYQKKGTADYTYPVRLSIVISVYKTSDLADQLLRSIFDPKSGFDVKKDEVIVLDNATDDNFAPLITKYPKARFIEFKVNQGFVGGYNRLLEYTRGELVLMLNSDMEVKPNALTSLINHSINFKNEVVLSGKLLFPDGTLQDSCFNLPTIWGAVKEILLNKKGSYFMYMPRGKRPAQVECAVMACFLIPRKVINQIGYLNRKLFMYFEDVDYCRRLKKAGIPIYFCPDAEFFHHHGATAKKIGKSAINK